MSKSKKKGYKNPSKLFSITKETYKTVYRFLGCTYTKRYPEKELYDKINKLISLKQTHQKKISYEIKSNKIIIIKENGEEIVNPPFIDGLDIQISGENNTITIYEPFSFRNSNIVLTGDIDILIKKNSLMGAEFFIKKTRNILPNKLIIGENYRCGRNCTIDLTDAGDIEIGDDAKWSWNIYVKSDDTHPIFNMDTGQCINRSSAIKIGHHVWIGMNAAILKNSIIKDNTVIGAYSVVAKKFEESNVIIAGNPAKIVKQNINWSHGSVEGYIRQCSKNTEF